MQIDRDPFAPLGVLGDLTRFVAWREEARMTKDGREATTKVPYDPKRDRRASATDPATWGTLAQARHRARPGGKLLGSNRTGGVGTVTGPLPDSSGLTLVGADLDTCLDDAGELTAWAREIVDGLGCYAEVSPSRTGVKLFALLPDDAAQRVAAALPAGKQGKQVWTAPKRQGDLKAREIAVYAGARWFAFTGDALPGSPPRIGAVKDVGKLLALIRGTWPALPGREAHDDDALPVRVRDTTRSGRLLAEIGWRHRAGQGREEIREAVEGIPDLAACIAEKSEREFDRSYEKVVREAGADTPHGATQRAVANFVKSRHGRRMRFCRATGRAFVWAGHTWKPDDRAVIRSWIAGACTALRAVAGGRLASLENYATVEGAEKWLRDDGDLVTVPADWNRDADLLGTPGAVVDLRTGEMRDGLPEDMICSATAVVPVPADDFDLAIDAPHWHDLLMHVSGGSAAVADFLQRWAGYALTGDTREQKFLFAHGPGGTGKSIFFNTLRRLAGSYGKTIGSEVLMATKHERHLTELAQLDGARFVVASEIEPGRGWAEARLKSLTGDDPISARFMRGDHFEFVPRLKLTIFGNDKPSFRQADDEAIRRRLIVLEFAHKPASPDPKLAAKLREEWPAILRWAINGAVKWYADGLPIPKAAQDAADAYLAEQDDLGRWLAECCDVGEGLQDTSANIWASWCSYASEEGVACGSQRRLIQTLVRRGFLPKRTMKARVVVGLQVIAQEDEDDLGDL